MNQTLDDLRWGVEIQEQADVPHEPVALFRVFVFRHFVILFGFVSQESCRSRLAGFTTLCDQSQSWSFIQSSLDADSTHRNVLHDWQPLTVFT
jgi:hypothetical protein